MALFNTLVQKEESRLNATKRESEQYKTAAAGLCEEYKTKLADAIAEIARLEAALQAETASGASKAAELDGRCTELKAQLEAAELEQQARRDELRAAEEVAAAKAEQAEQEQQQAAEQASRSPTGSSLARQTSLPTIFVLGVK